MKCLLCGKDHERGTPHPLNEADMAFWNGRMNIIPETIIVADLHEREEIREIIKTKKRGRPRHE